MLIVSIGIAGFLLMIAGVVALIGAWRFASQGAHPANWKRLFDMALFCGGMFAIASWLGTYWLAYPYSSAEGPGRVVGIPFIVAYFDSEGRDYIFDFMGLSVLANGIFWFLIPPSLLRLYGARWRNNHTSRADHNLSM